MSKLSGFFDLFFDLEQIPLEDINQWLKNKVEPHTLINYLANHILYPQVIPVDKDDLEIDLAILREAVRRNPNVVYNPQKQVVMISQELARRFPPLPTLVVALVEVLKLSEVTSLYLVMEEETHIKKSNPSLQYLAPVISPAVKNRSSFKISVNGNEHKIPVKTVTLLPLTGHMSLDFGEGKQYHVRAGELGVILDLNQVQK